MIGKAQEPAADQTESVPSEPARPNAAGIVIVLAEAAVLIGASVFVGHRSYWAGVRSPQCHAALIGLVATALAVVIASLLTRSLISAACGKPWSGRAAAAGFVALLYLPSLGGWAYAFGQRRQPRRCCPLVRPSATKRTRQNRPQRGQAGAVSKGEYAMKRGVLAAGQRSGIAARNALGAAFGVLVVASSAAWAADMPGAQDHPVLKRFGGSEIVAYETKRFDATDLQTSTFKTYNLATKRREFAKPPVHVEGAVTRLWYEAAGEASATELIRNYRNELAAGEFAILYDSTSDPDATNWVNFLAPFAELKIATTISYYAFYSADPGGVRVLTAKRERPEGDVFVQVIAVEWPKDEPSYKAKRGAYAAVDVVETRPMAQNMVVVSAGEMSKAISATGRVALYGIFFDTNKADIKAESRPALEEIAKLLKQDPDLKLHVVGHTDNVGGYEFNLDLSRRRAVSVATALANEFGIAAGRLIPNGVSYLAPVASNATEEGRAKNRRVELVPQ